MNPPPSTKGKKLIKINALTFGLLVEAMLDGTMTCQELADHTGLHYVTVLHYTRAMHKAGAVHISSWETDVRGRHCIKVYKIGHGRDAKRPRLSAAERQRAYKAKQRQRETLQAIAGVAA